MKANFSMSSAEVEDFIEKLDPNMKIQDAVEAISSKFKCSVKEASDAFKAYHGVGNFSNNFSERLRKCFELDTSVQDQVSGNLLEFLNHNDSGAFKEEGFVNIYPDDDGARIIGTEFHEIFDPLIEKASSVKGKEVKDKVFGVPCTCKLRRMIGVQVLVSESDYKKIAGELSKIKITFVF